MNSNGRGRRGTDSEDLLFNKNAQNQTTAYACNVYAMHGTFTYDSHFSNSETCKCENFTVINKQD